MATSINMKHTMHQGSRHQKSIFRAPMAIALLALLAQTCTASPVNLAKTTEESKTIIDLSHQLSNKTPHWPATAGFDYKVDINMHVQLNATNRSYHVLGDSFCTAVHVGTHLDAPAHFNPKGWTVEKIPLERLIDIPLTVVDVSEKVTKNRSYEFVKDDFIDKISNQPLVKANSVVLVYTGLGKSYQGTENLKEMSMPGFSPEAANFLVSQKVYGVGLDSPSADSQGNGTNDPADFFQAHSFQAHSILNGNNIYILENINGNLSQLVKSKSARLTVAPLAIENGSGSQVRVIAVTGRDES